MTRGYHDEPELDEAAARAARAFERNPLTSPAEREPPQSWKVLLYGTLTVRAAFSINAATALGLEM